MWSLAFSAAVIVSSDYLLYPQFIVYLGHCGHGSRTRNPFELKAATFGGI